MPQVYIVGDLIFCPCCQQFVPSLLILIQTNVHHRYALHRAYWQKTENKSLPVERCPSLQVSGGLGQRTRQDRPEKWISSNEKFTPPPATGRTAGSRSSVLSHVCSYMALLNNSKYFNLLRLLYLFPCVYLDKAADSLRFGLTVPRPSPFQSRNWVPKWMLRTPTNPTDK